MVSIVWLSERARFFSGQLAGRNLKHSLTCFVNIEGYKLPRSVVFPEGQEGRIRPLLVRQAVGGISLIGGLFLASVLQSPFAVLVVHNDHGDGECVEVHRTPCFTSHGIPKHRFFLCHVWEDSRCPARDLRFDCG